MPSLVDYRPAFLTLFREAFHGTPEGLDYTWFVQGREAIFPSLESLTAEQASRSPGPEIASIVAHAYHLLFALRAAMTNLGGPEPEGSWKSSWEKTEASPSEWRQLQSDIHEAYEAIVTAISQQGPESDEDTLNGTLAILPHVAFHLGAIRQLMKV